MNYQTKVKIFNAIQYGFAEYADNPLVFKDGFANNGTKWIEDLLKEGIVEPVFKTQDYWYLKVYSHDGDKFAAPDDWIIQDQNGKLSIMSNDDFVNQFEKINS